MKYRPPAGQGPFQRGERLTAAKLNDVVNAIRPVRAGGRAGIMGDTVVSDETETAYIRVTGANGANHSWVEVYRTPNGTWANTTRTGNLTYDWAVERNNISCPVGPRVYEARRSPDTSEWIFAKDASVSEFRGKDVLTLILGPWENYKDCEGAPPDPPVATDPNCPPAYAWAGYKVCGYRFKKVSHFLTTDEDAETPGDIPVVGMGFWATELNGQSTSSWRRFHRSWWGWDAESNSVTDPDVDCAGVRFESPNLPAINCSCPPWLQAIQCIKLRVKYVADPGPPTDPSCEDCYEKMAGFWGTEETALLCNQQMGCVWQSNEGPSPFQAATATYQNLYELDPCFTGPEWFDPCDPCDGFATLAVGINDATTAAGGCAAAGNFYVGGRVPSLSELRDFVEACTAGGSPPPIRLEKIRKAGPCGNYVEWMQIECCSCEESNLECGTMLDCGE